MSERETAYSELAESIAMMAVTAGLLMVLIFAWWVIT
jgi:hypothetical protein